MLILESEQGKLKSSALSILAADPEWFLDDLPLSADTKTVIERLSGKWIVEAGELKGMRRSDVEHLKSFLSRQEDHARLAYGRMVSEVKRQCVIVGTTNGDKYLKDMTGNRRFWPVKVGEFDLARLRRDRDQLWAEAADREARGESIRLARELWEAAAAEQEQRRAADGWEDALSAVLDGMSGKLRSVDAWTIVGVPVERRTQDQNERLGAVLRRIGWERKKARFGQTPEWCYARGEPGDQQARIYLTLDGRGNVVRATHEPPPRAA